MSLVEKYCRTPYFKPLWEEKIKTKEGRDEFNSLLARYHKEVSLIADEYGISNSTLEKCKQGTTIYGIILRSDNQKYKKFIDLHKLMVGQNRFDLLLRPYSENAFTDWIELHEWYYGRKMK